MTRNKKFEKALSNSRFIEFWPLKRPVVGANTVMTRLIINLCGHPHPPFGLAPASFSLSAFPRSSASRTSSSVTARPGMSCRYFQRFRGAGSATIFSSRNDWNAAEMVLVLGVPAVGVGPPSHDDGPYHMLRSKGHRSHLVRLRGIHATAAHA